MVRFFSIHTLLAAVAATFAVEFALTGNPHEFQEHARRLFTKIPSMMETATRRMLQDSGATAHADVCTDPGLEELVIGENTMKVLKTMPKFDLIMDGLKQYAEDGITVGSTTSLICEASDAAVSGATVADGQSGDTDFPHGNIKPLATCGERSVCDGTYGQKIAGVPDGLGAYLADDETLRVVVQSESYGPLNVIGDRKYYGPRSTPTYAYLVNNGQARIGGSHIQYVDYVRSALSTFMESSSAASTMVTGMGEMVETIYNLKGELLGPRNGVVNTTTGAHYSNTDEHGAWAVREKILYDEYDWHIQSLCSAHMEERHQWGSGIGFKDDIFLTVEEWMAFDPNLEFVGLSAHAVNVHTKTMYAVGSLTQGGFEKYVELNPQHTDYVILGLSGYNGAFESSGKIPEPTLNARIETYGPRADGMNYTWTKDIVPFRIYVGVKGKLEDGSDASDDDFLARNGLKYGKLYGFAIDMRNETVGNETIQGPTAGVWRDTWHKTASNGDMIPGKWIAQDWQWDGTPRNFQHDGAWDYQNPPPGAEPDTELEGFHWWTANGPSEKGCKTEHLSPDPRPGTTSFIQGSVCGYFGHLYVQNVADTLASTGGELPAMFDGEYYVYQGETDITSQVVLGGKGQYTEGRLATHNWDKDGVTDGGKVTFEDIDGLEVVESNGLLYAIIQEDSGSKLGERMLISGPLEHDADGKDLTYYFVAMSGGEKNTRIAAGVGIPEGVVCHDGDRFVADAHEFSGVFDLSGLLRKDSSGNFIVKASDDGSAKRANDAQVMINDKYIVMSLQAGNMFCGVLGGFQLDRGGQWLLYQPNLPDSALLSPEK